MKHTLSFTWRLACLCMALILTGCITKHGNKLDISLENDTLVVDDTLEDNNTDIDTPTDSQVITPEVVVEDVADDDKDDLQSLEDSLKAEAAKADSLNAPNSYSYTDASGNYHSGDGTHVSDGSSKVVYLTFDDGPSPNTEHIVQILRDSAAYATFFVTGQNPKCFKYIREAYEAGNAIAAHTYSHQWSIYKDFDAYFADLDRIENIIEEYTGHRTNVIRFPGGSSNHMFALHNHDAKFMIKLALEVQNRGYQYVDWNVDSQDASTVRPSRELVVANACNDKYNTVCVLMHDTQAKAGTVEALPSIIHFFRSRGYEFRTLQTTDYICHHTINRFSGNPSKAASSTASVGSKRSSQKG